MNTGSTPDRALSNTTPATIDQLPGASYNFIDYGAYQQVEAEIDKLFSLIPEMTADELLSVAAYAERLGLKAFLLRGACTYKLLASGDAEPLPGGRNHKDAEGRGRQAQLARLAARIQVTPKTLKTDARIYATFFKNDRRNKTTDARFLTLSREIFVIALSAPEPLAAIETAFIQAGQQPFGRRQFRQYIQSLNSSNCVGPQTRDLKKTPRLVLPRRLSPEAERALVAAQELTGQELATILAHALLSYHETLRRTLRKSKIRTRTPAKQRDKSASVDSPSAHRTQNLTDRQPALF